MTTRSVPVALLEHWELWCTESTEPILRKAARDMHKILAAPEQPDHAAPQDDPIRERMRKIRRESAPDKISAEVEPNRVISALGCEMAQNLTPPSTSPAPGRSLTVIKFSIYLKEL